MCKRALTSDTRPHGEKATPFDLVSPLSCVELYGLTSFFASADPVFFF
jgi:hypothetical protein